MPASLLQTIRDCQQQDLKAQEALYRHCYPEMIRVCLRYAHGSLSEAGALYNAAMLRVFRKIAQFRNEGEVLAWVRRIVVTVCIDHCRARARFATEPIDACDEPEPVLPEIYNRFSGNDILQLVHSLPKNTGLVFNLFVLEGYKHEEIAGLLGISAGTSKWHLSEARRLLRQKLESLFQQEKISHAS